METTKEFSSEEILSLVKVLVPRLTPENEFLKNSIFIERLKGLKDFVEKKTNSFLSAETLRFQTILFYLSIILLLIASLQLGSIKLLGNIIMLEYAANILLVGFHFGITLIFITKALIDIKISKLGSVFERFDVRKMQEYMDIRIAETIIEQYYLAEINLLISRKLKELSAFISEETKDPSYLPSEMLIDKSGIDISVFETNSEFKISEKNIVFQKIIFLIDKEVDDFKSELRLLLKKETEPYEFSEMYWKIAELKKESLSKWREIQIKLSELDDETIKNHVEKKDSTLVREAKTFGSVLTNIKTVRKWLIFIEVILPISFGLGALMYFLLVAN